MYTRYKPGIVGRGEAQRGMSRKYKPPRLREVKWGNETTGTQSTSRCKVGEQDRDENMNGRDVNKKKTNADTGQSREIRMGREIDE